MRLCIERILPTCCERAVRFALPPIESAADIAPAMKAVTSALAAGIITPGEAGTIAAVVDTFVRAIETSDFDRRLKIWRPTFPNVGHRAMRAILPTRGNLRQIRVRLSQRANRC